jgi:peptidoglycan/xylan/chitin deacetylase (PgdA/CDA1 family)
VGVDPISLTSASTRIGTPQRELEVDEEQRWIQVYRFEEMLEMIQRYPFIRITFDDENASDVSCALPVFLRHGLTATFFVVACRIDTQGAVTSDGSRRW